MSPHQPFPPLTREFMDENRVILTTGIQILRQFLVIDLIVPLIPLLAVMLGGRPSITTLGLTVNQMVLLILFSLGHGAIEVISCVTITGVNDLVKLSVKTVDLRSVLVRVLNFPILATESATHYQISYVVYIGESLHIVSSCIVS